MFANLTVLENLKAGAYLRKDKDGIEKDIKWVYELFPRLEERNWRWPVRCPGGERSGWPWPRADEPPQAADAG